MGTLSIIELISGSNNLWRLSCLESLKASPNSSLPSPNTASQNSLAKLRAELFSEKEDIVPLVLPPEPSLVLATAAKAPCSEVTKCSITESYSLHSEHGA